MPLSNEDILRINVLLANKVEAIRIDEGKMTLHGLTEAGDATVSLNPNCRDDQYLKQVRELLSGHVLGSPGGYPVYLKRWTRMGQAKDDSLAELLLLGEPEAVVAVVHAAGLTNDLARRAWWAMPVAENARRMLRRDAVLAGAMGKLLADYLVDYLPFEESHSKMIETVRLVLQPGLIDEPARISIWNRAKTNKSYLLGFLAAMPDDLPGLAPAHNEYDLASADLAALVAAGNIYARHLRRVLSGPGQTFLAYVVDVLQHPATQDVVLGLFEVIADYFSDLRLSGLDDEEDLGKIIRFAQSACGGDLAGIASQTDLHDLIRAMPQFTQGIAAMMVLSMLDYAIVRPIFSRTTADGSLMCEKLAPVSQQILGQIALLRGQDPGQVETLTGRRRGRRKD